MTHASDADDQRSLLAQLHRLLRTATLQRMVLADPEGREVDERVLLDSHLARTPPKLFASQKAPFL